MDDKSINSKHDENSMDDTHWFMIMINSIMYLGTCIQYLFVTAAISFVVVMYEKAKWEDILIILLNSLGLLLGIIQAEYLRRKKRLIEYSAFLKSSPDVDVIMEEHRNKFPKENTDNDTSVN